jgi:hypothetical protein
MRKLTSHTVDWVIPARALSKKSSKCLPIPRPAL